MFSIFVYHVIVIYTLLQDVSRLQIEKKEAESAGKAFYEQYKDLQKSSKDNEGALLAEVQQDLSQAHSEFKASQEEAEGLRAQVKFYFIFSISDLLAKVFELIRWLSCNWIFSSSKTTNSSK